MGLFTLGGLAPIAVGDVGPPSLKLRKGKGVVVMGLFRVVSVTGVLRYDRSKLSGQCFGSFECSSIGNL